MFDGGVPGFGLHVRPSGHCSFVLQYRLAGRSRKLTLGVYGRVTPEQARTGNTASWTVGLRKQQWDYFDLKLGHISFFNPLSMRILAKKAGFDVVKIETRSVSLRDKGSASWLEYRVAKLAGEALSLPARLLNRGHDMLAVLKKAG